MLLNVVQCPTMLLNTFFPLYAIVKSYPTIIYKVKSRINNLSMPHTYIARENRTRERIGTANLVELIIHPLLVLLGHEWCVC